MPGFYNLDIVERVRKLAELRPITQEEQWQLLRETLSACEADMFIENVIGVFGFPIGLATNFRINGKDYLVPMVIEESSVVAAASCAARLVRNHGTLISKASDPIMIGQIQIAGVQDFEAARDRILEVKPRLLELANQQDPVLVKLGGGARDLEIRQLDTITGTQLIVHILMDARDAMGANAVNTMAETLGPMIADIAQGELVCRIISNLSDRRLVYTRAEVAVDVLGRGGFSGRDVARRIVEAYAFAEADPYRATTHNKGVMNGIDAVVLATGNDWRAVEAGAHAYAARSGRYKPLSRYRIEDDKLIAEMEIPLALGLVGGVTRLHTAVKILTRIMGVRTSQELAEVVAAAGLLQNLAALRSLASEGIQKGHMALHARNVAVSAGARGDLIDVVAKQMVKERNVRFHRAQEILARFNHRNGEYDL